MRKHLLLFNPDYPLSSIRHIRYLVLLLHGPVHAQISTNVLKQSKHHFIQFSPNRSIRKLELIGPGPPFPDFHGITTVSPLFHGGPGPKGPNCRFAMCVRLNPGIPGKAVRLSCFWGTGPARSDSETDQDPDRFYVSVVLPQWGRPSQTDFTSWLRKWSKSSPE